MAKKYNIKHFYDITDRSDFRANPDYKGVCHVAMAQEGHCLPGMQQKLVDTVSGLLNFSTQFILPQLSAWLDILDPQKFCLFRTLVKQSLHLAQDFRVRALHNEVIFGTGEVLFGTDSHTCNAGAFGQFASGVGNTDAGFILGTGKLLIKVPQTLRFVLDGQMPSFLMAKDLILHIIGEIGVAGPPPPSPSP